jgi:CRP-like cAMP-binding protein
VLAGERWFGRRAVGETVGMSPQAQDESLLAGALRREGHPRRFGRGQALFTEGDRAERVFLIERGWVLVSCTTPGGREIVLNLCGPGAVLGDLSAIDGEPRSATAVSVDQVEATVTPGSAIIRATEDPETAHELLRILAGRLRNADRKRLEFAALDTLGRIACRLLELSEQFGDQTADGLVVALPLSQEQLASWCGASRESTVKALASLRALGCIRTARRSVVIGDLEALRRYAQGHG